MDAKETKVQAQAAAARAESRMTEAQREAWQRQAFGVLAVDLDAALREAIGQQVRLGMRRASESADAARECVVFSMLSDAQAELGLGLHERARQTMNRAKWVLGDPDAIAAAAQAWADAVEHRRVAGLGR